MEKNVIGIPSICHPVHVNNFEDNHSSVTPQNFCIHSCFLIESREQKFVRGDRAVLTCTGVTELC